MRRAALALAVLAALPATAAADAPEGWRPHVNEARLEGPTWMLASTSEMAESEMPTTSTPRGVPDVSASFAASRATSVADSIAWRSRSPASVPGAVAT